MHNHKPLPLAVAALLAGLLFISVPAFGQGPLLKSSGFISPIPIPYVQVSAPVFVSSPGNYFWPDLAISISTSTSGAYIRYTTDGSTPSPTHGTVYSAPVIFHLSPYQIVELRAIAYTQYVNYFPSAVTTEYYTYYPPLPLP